MSRRLLPALVLLAALGAALVFLRLSPRGPERPALPPGGLSQVELPPLRYGEVEGLRTFKRAGADRFQVEVAAEKVEKRLEAIIPFLSSPPEDSADLEKRFPGIRELLADGVTVEPLVPSRERLIHRSRGTEAFQGEFDPPPHGQSLARGALEMAREVAQLFRPLRALESASLKVIRIVGPAAGPAASEVIYQLAGQGPDGARREWNGRWMVEWSAGLAIAGLRPLEATRVVLARRPFEDVSAAALLHNPEYVLQLRPGLDYFRDRIDAATGIDVYGHHGIAVGDLDGDLREDLYLPEPPGLPSLILHTRKDGRFDISRHLIDGASQALLLDLDNDGDQDLFLVGENGVTVLKNDGWGELTPHPSGLEKLESAQATTICAAAADYDLDGAVDVYVGSYVFWRGSASQVGSRLPFPYHDARNGAPNFLLRNRGDGSFRDVTREAGLSEGNDRFTFAVAWGDYDDDGYPDLAVANDFGSKNLFRNRGNGTFLEVTAPAGATDLGAGMSAAWEDYDCDGRLDLYFGNMFSTAGLRVTSWEEFKPGSPLREDYQKHARGNTLLRNRGDGTFEDVSFASRAYMGRWAWSSDFLDFDLDGREDIYISNGFVTNPDSHDL